jgi:hypothetical protein
MHSNSSAAPAAERYVVLDSWRGNLRDSGRAVSFSAAMAFPEHDICARLLAICRFLFCTERLCDCTRLRRKAFHTAGSVCFRNTAVRQTLAAAFALLMFVLGAALIKFAARAWGPISESPAMRTTRLIRSSRISCFLHSFGLHDTVTWNTPSWSIGAEFLTNLMFGIAFLLAPWGRISVALALAAVGAVDLLVFSEKNIDTSAQFGLFRCMYGFFIGYVIYRIAVAEGMPSLRGHRAASVLSLPV